MKKEILLIPILFGLLLLIVSANAYALPTFIGPSPYLSEADSPFLVDINAGTTYLENFEDHLLNTPGVTATAGSGVTSVVFGPSLHDSVDGDDGTIDGLGLDGDSYFYRFGNPGITFTFDATILGGLPTQAGIVWTDGLGLTSFEAFGVGNVSLGQIGPVAIADISSAGTTDEDRFFGVTDLDGIYAIRISNTVGGIEVDHLQYGKSSMKPIPEPTTMLLLGSGLVGLAGFRKRFRKA